MTVDSVKPDRKKAAFHNLGCKVNSYELDIIRQDFLENGYEEADFDDTADVYIVNTCTVTGIAGKKSRQMLRRAKRKNPDAVVIAIGCYVEKAGDTIPEGEELADICIGSRKKLETFAIYQAYLERTGHSRPDSVQDAAAGNSPFRYQEDFAEQPFPKTGKGLVLPGRTRADIKVQDGCDRFCTYCIIPHVRGRITSRDEEDVIGEIRELAGNGVREVILSGIHIGSYGADKGRKPEEALPDLIEKVSEIEGIERIRIGSIEPVMASEEVVKRLAGIRGLCPHFHLSLQSGCDKTLRRMNRRYSAKEYRESVAYLRKYFDRPAITTDVIVGFPGETEEDFEECRRFLEDLGFYMIHVFKYSKRHGTPAAGFPDQLTEKVKAERSDILISLTEKQAEEYRKLFDGENVTIYPEQVFPLEGKLWCTGHTANYIEVCAGLEGTESAVNLPQVMSGRLDIHSPVKGMMLLHRDS